MRAVVVGGLVVEDDIGGALGGRGMGLRASERDCPLGAKLPRRPTAATLWVLFVELGVAVFVVVEASEGGEREVVGVRCVRPFKDPLATCLPFPFLCSGCGVLGVAVWVDALDSEEVEGEGETEREDVAEDIGVVCGDFRDVCTRLRVSRTCLWTS